MAGTCMRSKWGQGTVLGSKLLVILCWVCSSYDIADFLQKLKYEMMASWLGGNRKSLVGTKNSSQKGRYTAAKEQKIRLHRFVRSRPVLGGLVVSLICVGCLGIKQLSKAQKHAQKLSKSDSIAHKTRGVYVKVIVNNGFSQNGISGHLELKAQRGRLKYGASNLAAIWVKNH